MWLRETQTRCWEQIKHTTGDPLWKQAAALAKGNFSINQRSSWMNYCNILVLWGLAPLLAILWLHEQDSPLYFFGILLIAVSATLNLIFISHWREKARRQAAQQTTGLLPTVLEMTEALLHLPAKTNMQEEDHQSGVEDGIVEQQLLKLTCHMLECSAAAVIAIDPLTNRLNPIAQANSMLDLEQYWLTDIQDTYLQDHLSPEQIRRLQSGEVIHLTMPPGRSGLSAYEAFGAPVQLHGYLQGVFVLVYKKDKQYPTQEHIAQIKALSQTLARMLEREQRLHEHIEEQAGELVLRQTLRRMDESISLVSHELKTPLTAIHISAQLAQHRVRRLTTQELSDSPQADYTHTIDDVQRLLDRIENQVRIQNRLIDDLLDVPRQQTDQLKLETGCFNLVELVHEVTEEQRQTVPMRTIQDILPDEEEIPVTADRDRIRQVINNYLTNAIKYSPIDQPVILTLTHMGEEACIAVSDRGPGLTESEQERVWQRFYQAPDIKVQHGNSKGLGLGLHICRTIIEQHQGQIGVTSQPGSGSTFWFTLPVAS